MAMITLAGLQLRCHQAQCLQRPQWQPDIPGCRYAEIGGVDADEAAAVPVDHFVTEVPHGWDGSARADLDHHWAANVTQPFLLQTRLGEGRTLDPLAISEHQDVGSGQRAAVWAAGQILITEFSGGFVHLGDKVNG